MQKAILFCVLVCGPGYLLAADKNQVSRILRDLSSAANVIKSDATRYFNASHELARKAGDFSAIAQRLRTEMRGPNFVLFQSTVLNRFKRTITLSYINFTAAVSRANNALRNQRTHRTQLRWRFKRLKQSYDHFHRAIRSASVAARRNQMRGRPPILRSMMLSSPGTPLKLGFSASSFNGRAYSRTSLSGYTPIRIPGLEPYAPLIKSTRGSIRQGQCVVSSKVTVILKFGLSSLMIKKVGVEIAGTRTKSEIVLFGPAAYSSPRTWLRYAARGGLIKTKTLTLDLTPVIKAYSLHKTIRPYFIDAQGRKHLTTKRFRIYLAGSSFSSSNKMLTMTDLVISTAGGRINVGGAARVRMGNRELIGFKASMPRFNNCIFTRSRDRVIITRATFGFTPASAADPYKGVLKTGSGFTRVINGGRVTSPTIAQPANYRVTSGEWVIRYGLTVTGMKPTRLGVGGLALPFRNRVVIDVANEPTITR